MTEPADSPTPFDPDDLRRRAQKRLRDRRGGSVGNLPAKEVEALVHELEVHHVELEVQNEELRRTQNDLLEAHNRYRDLYEFAPVGYLSLNTDGVILQANLAAADLCSFERGEIIGARLEALVAPDDRDACYLYLRKVLETPVGQQAEFRFRRPDGSIFYAAVNTTPTPATKPDNCSLFRMTLTDITARKQAEEDLHQLNAELEQRVEKRTSQLSRRAEQLRKLTWTLTLAEERERRRIANVLHDNQQQLLAAAKLPLISLEASRDETARRAAAKVEPLIDQAIDCARTLTEALSPPILYQGGLQPAIEWLADWMREKQGMDIQLDIQPNAEPATEDTRVLVFCCVRELLFNVVKHAGVKTVAVRLCNRDGKTEITVSDEGVGFDPEEIERQAVKEGGIGLFATRERMELLGGKLEIESAPGKGSRFTLIAPQSAIILPAPVTSTP